MTTTPEPPQVPDDQSGAGAAAGADDARFDTRIALGITAALLVVGAVGPFGWHLLSSTTGGSTAGAAAAAAVGGGGAGANANAAVASPAAATSKPTTANPAESAAAACTAALNASPAGGSATTASVRAWGVTAAPSISALRTDSATLHGIVVSQDAAAVPVTAKSLCDHAATGGQLTAMPDTVGSTAWRAALSAYIAAATDALAAANNHPAYWQAAQAQLAQGEQELDTLTGHITAVG
jgi:hypothetical protein